MPKLIDDLNRNSIIPIILLIDTSGNAPEAVAELNEIMSDFADFVAKYSKEYNVYKYKLNLSAITYSTDAKIIFQSVDSSDFQWNAITTSGLSDLGSGLKKLPEVVENICNNLEHNNRIVKPTIIFIARNEPTDNYLKQFELLKNYDWFVSSDKIAFNYGGDLDSTSFLSHITENPETSNIPISLFTTAVRTYINGLIATLQDSSADIEINDKFWLNHNFCNDRLIMVDPINELPKFSVIINSGKIDINGTVSVTKCQISPCDPKQALDKKFELCEKNGFIEVSNCDTCCYVDYYISSSTTRSIDYNLHSDITFIISKDTSSEDDYKFKINSSGNLISITNNAKISIYVRQTFNCGEHLLLNDKDRITDKNENVILTVEAVEYVPITSLTGSIVLEDIIDDETTDDTDSWDDF